MLYHFDDGHLVGPDRREDRENNLAIAARAVIALLSQNKVYPGDMEIAKKWLRDALAS